MIRILELSDIGALYLLMQELNEDLHEDQVVSLESIELNYKYMDQHKDSYYNIVYEIDNEVIGFASLVFYKSVYHKNGTALLNELIVTAKYRNKGIGKELLECCINEGKKRRMDEIEVGVMKENKKAIKFYKENGLLDEYLILGMEY